MNDRSRPPRTAPARPRAKGRDDRPAPQGRPAKQVRPAPPAAAAPAASPAPHRRRPAPPVKKQPLLANPGDVRIVKKLAGVYPETSASRLKRAVVEGQVTVNGRRVDDPGAFVNEKDTVAWDENARVQRRIESSLTVLFEDDDLVVVVKPAGLLTHPTEAKEKDTLQSRVSGYIAHKKKTRGYVSVVHRLDKDTSGALSFALSKRGMVLLQAQLRAHTLDRRYLAVVEGAMKGESGTYNRDLVEDRGDLRRGVAKTGEKGLSAVTRWKVVERFGTLATLVEARLETGRTHQVRLHFNHAGHPLVGEKVYRDPKKPPFPIDCPRQALHAGLLGWVGHDGVARKVEVPLPADFEKLLYELRRRTAKK